jgi:hypothetical protein
LHLSEKIKLSFAETFDGIIWKTLVDPEGKRLLAEVRNAEKKIVTFSVVDLESGRCLWKDQQMEEPWWISLQAISGNTLLFTLYTDSSNPDKKSILAFDVGTKKTLWWKNNFVVASVYGDRIKGTDVKFGSREVTINVSDGTVVPHDSDLFAHEQNFDVIRPFQYQEGTAHFDTVKMFLETKCQISPTISIEYCEFHSLILISVFVQQNDLANYLFVFNSDGELMLKETLGIDLKGIALDTFFIFSGYLIFVSNKRELRGYKIV